MIHAANFKDYLVESDWVEYEIEINSIIEHIQNGNELNESILDNLSKKMKNGIEFIKDFSRVLGVEFLDMLKLFKNKVLFSFFSKIGWSIKKLVALVKKGFKLQKQVKQLIAEYIAETGVVKFTKDKLTDLDNFLEKHPIIKKAGALVVVGFLIYQWTEMISFTGDIEFDFDQTLLFEAIKGDFSLAALFATADGIQMLLFIATGVLTGISFPWPGSTWILFAMSIVYTIAKDKYPAVAKSIIRNAKKFKHV